MSQTKVVNNKANKNNMSPEEIAKQKKREKIEKIGVWTLISVLVVIILGSGAYKGVEAYKAKLAAMPTYDSSSFILSDMSGVLETEEAE